MALNSLGGSGIERRTIIRSALIGGVSLGAGGLLSACSGSKSSSAPKSPGAKKKGGALRVGLTGGSSSDTLNPFLAGITAIGTARAQQLYQPLVQLGSDAQVEYVLATQIATKGSSSRWIIRLRKGVTFHDGKPFGADDVIYTLRTILDPKKPLGGATVLSPVNVTGLKKIDDLTVEVPMKTPFGSFPEQLAAFWYFLYIAPNGWKDGDKPNGTGPFAYKSFAPGQQSVFVRNTKYWKPGHPYLDTVTIQNFEDGNAVVNALISNAIDCTGQLEGSQMKLLAKSKSIKALPSKTGSIEPFTMRVDKPALQLSA